MKIVIEIGTEEQKELIANEIGIIKEICERLQDLLPICGIWVPADFDKTINELQGTSNYISERGHLAVAKNVQVGDETALVFSRKLFTDNHDNYTRMQIILHELYHIISGKVFPEPPKDSPATYAYLQNLYILFDEYWVNRMSFETTEKIYPNVSARYKKLTRSSVTGFLRDIIKSGNDYEHIKLEIHKFRYHGDSIRFIQNTRNNFDIIAKSLVYFFSYIHHYPNYSRLLKFLPTSKFVGKSELTLGDFFKQKYEQNEVDIFEGLVYFQNFMEKFGVRFEDKDGGLYCTVLDI